MCPVDYCLYPWLPDSTIISVSLVIVSGLVIWKIVKAIVDTIPVLG